MYSSVTVAGGSLLKRLADNPPSQTQWPSAVATFVFIADFVVFLPVILILVYTLSNVYPTLAAVEDPLPDYEAVPMNDDGTPKTDNDPVSAAQPGKPITGSLRATNALIRSRGGWLANFRGLGYAVLVQIIVALTAVFLALAPFIPFRIAHLIALLAAAPLATTWTHLVITPPSTKSFFRRIPSLKKVYVAAWFPTFLFWAAVQASVLFPELLGRGIGLCMRDPNNPDKICDQPKDGSYLAKVIAVAGLSLALQVLLAIPAHAALARVQASLLPADEDPIVPFDRSFAGRVEPEVVTGKGFATFGAAIKTIPRSSWLRIYLLRVKVFFVSVGAYFVMGTIVGLEVLVMGLISAGK
ncbi:hypothetical protein CHGG_04530 [Chaetomium globosum CBS 148.51]|jgi:hypothetical protein|uniref:Ubiquitin carrier protein n=1 Tax=Chaetomium globosum (strain ATCC 6205 / CBS 148.51 / DSM 1962 / NBRC 6347 / NRRL 1970) TaxID=306901 RepID=Q2H116_CHAGB|nr:uncharacterized protein CHGG_04530 [Chaetomium globosum CBS 148.51]EAQ87911.1 hypothetical protein CHGG_04530 [Chaetomium globosum CBS 148.51]